MASEPLVLCLDILREEGADIFKKDYGLENSTFITAINFVKSFLLLCHHPENYDIYLSVALKSQNKVDLL